jgi:hypothetical protein
MQGNDDPISDQWTQFAAEVRQWSLGIHRRMVEWSPDISSATQDQSIPSDEGAQSPELPIPETEPSPEKSA